MYLDYGLDGILGATCGGGSVVVREGRGHRGRQGEREGVSLVGSH